MYNVLFCKCTCICSDINNDHCSLKLKECYALRLANLATPSSRPVKVVAAGIPNMLTQSGRLHLCIAWGHPGGGGERKVSHTI